MNRRSFIAGSLAASAALTRGLPEGLRSSVVVETPPILPRSTWAEGRVPKGPVPAEEVKFLIVHHTAEPGNGYEESDVPRLLRGIFDYHTGGAKGWPDIAYNFFVDSSGRIWEGRTGSVAGPVAGSATGGNQGFSQLCCFLGDHSATPPTLAAQDSMVALLAWLADRYGVDTAPGATVRFVSKGSNRWPAGESVTAPTIAAHTDMSTTECPGAACIPLVRVAFPAAVQARRGAPLEPTAGSVPGAAAAVTTTTTTSPPPPSSSSSTSTFTSTSTSTSSSTEAPATTGPDPGTTGVRAADGSSDPASAAAGDREDDSAGIALAVGGTAALAAATGVALARRGRGPEQDA